MSSTVQLGRRQKSLQWRTHAWFMKLSSEGFPIAQKQRTWILGASALHYHARDPDPFTAHAASTGKVLARLTLQGRGPVKQEAKKERAKAQWESSHGCGHASPRSLPGSSNVSLTAPELSEQV